MEALAFLVHFIGDIHMPLHSGDLDDRGGNDRETTYGIVPGLNLHWVWDGPLAERAEFMGPDGRMLRIEPSSNARFVRVWGAG